MASDSKKIPQKIGFAGLGAMGLPMAVNLLKSGFSVCGYDIRTEAIEAFRAAGGKGAATASEAAAQADLFIVMVATSEQVDAVLFGETGAISSLPAGTTVILNSTVSPVYARLLEKRLSESRHLLLDAPVSGGTDGAKEGSLTVMTAGSSSAYQAAVPALRAIASKVYHLGKESGIGSTVKMINQLLVGVHSAVTAEAMALGVRAGIDPQVLYEVISNSAGTSFVFNKRAPQMIKGDFTTTAALDIFVKDLGIVLKQPDPSTSQPPWLPPRINSLSWELPPVLEKKTIRHLSRFSKNYPASACQNRSTRKRSNKKRRHLYLLSCSDRLGLNGIFGCGPKPFRRSATSLQTATIWKSKPLSECRPRRRRSTSMQNRAATGSCRPHRSFL